MGGNLGALRIHVPGLLPGEHAQVELVHVRRHAKGDLGTAFGRIVRRMDAGNDRVMPACAAYGLCGGCVLQHLAYPAQLMWKQQRVEFAVGKTLGEEVARAAVSTCAPSPQPLGYRSRVKLVVVQNRTELGTTVTLGAYAPRSHEVIDMAGCMVNARALSALARSVKEVATRLALSCYDEAARTGALRYVLLRETRRGDLQLSLVTFEPLPEATLRAFVGELCAAHPKLVSVVLHQNRSPGNALLPSAEASAEASDFVSLSDDRVLYGRDYVWEDIGPVSLRVSARSFLQVNREIAERIYQDAGQDAAQAAKSSAPASARVLDLYSGVGGLGLTVLSALADAQLVGIESNPHAVKDAQHSAEKAGLSEDRARFLCGAVEALLPEVLRAGNVDIALINPPRKGLSQQVLSLVLATPPRRILYMSCSPESLARDLTELCAQKYKLQKITPYDMHPGTTHVESLAVLDRV